MVSPPKSMRRVGRAARTGLVGGIVAALACFDALLLGMPIAALASMLRPSFVFITAAVAVSFLSIACCTWVDRQWDESSSRNAMRVERRLAQMRSSRLMAHPVALDSARLGPLVRTGGGPGQSDPHRGSCPADERTADRSEKNLPGIGRVRDSLCSALVARRADPR